MGLRGTNWHQEVLWKSVGREGQATHEVVFTRRAIFCCVLVTHCCVPFVEGSRLGHSMCYFLIQRETGMSSVSLILSGFLFVFCLFLQATGERAPFLLSSAHLLL